MKVEYKEGLYVVEDAGETKTFTLDGLFEYFTTMFREEVKEVEKKMRVKKDDK